MVEAIRNGRVDAIVRTDEDGTKLYALEGPDRPYHKIVETMNAGAVTVDRRGTILYSNGPFSRMVRTPSKVSSVPPSTTSSSPKTSPCSAIFSKKPEK